MSEAISKLQIAERPVEDMTVLTLTGEIIGNDGDILLGKYVDDLLNRGRLKIVVNLAGVTYIDSAGVGMIVAEQKIAHKKGGAMKLTGLTNRSQRLLAMMKLLTVFETFDDEAAALRSFAWRPGN